MKIGIMQPYFFPYLGYWQLMNTVDRYVFLDDVNYKMRGWINRNYIQGKNGLQWFRIPVRGASQNKLINELSTFPDKRTEMKIYRSLEVNYHNAPYFQKVMTLVEHVLSYENHNLALFLIHSNIQVANYLKINTKFYISSKLGEKGDLKGERRIINICDTLDGDVYINSFGGQKLYSGESFKANGIDLYFLKSNTVAYKQFGRDYTPNLSILDVMMYNSQETIHKMLGQYTLIDSQH